MVSRASTGRFSEFSTKVSRWPRLRRKASGVFGLTAIAAAALVAATAFGQARSQQVLEVAAAAESDRVPESRPAGIDPQKQEAFKRGMAAARAAMRKRDVAAAKREVEAAAKRIQTPEEEAEANRLAVLAAHLGEFWKTMGRVVAGLAPTQEFAIRQTPAIVVEASPTQVTFRYEGRNLTYKINELPRPIVEALVKGGFAENSATKVLFGAYLAMDAQGDRRAARQVWQEALSAGEDVNSLMAELDVALPAGAAADSPSDTMEAGTSGAATAPADPATVERAEAAVRAQFKADYSRASSPSGKLKLSETLAAAADGAEVSADHRFVMLRDARDYALAAGKPEAACDAIDRMARYFSVDAVAMKTEALEHAAKKARTSTSNREVAECALAVTDLAILAGRSEEAGRLAAVALATAQRARNAALVLSAREAKQKAEAVAGQAGNSGTEKKGKR